MLNSIKNNKLLGMTIYCSELSGRKSAYTAVNKTVHNVSSDKYQLLYCNAISKSILWSIGKRQGGSRCKNANFSEPQYHSTLVHLSW